MKNAKKLKNAYKTPELKVYGGMAKLTAGGSGATMETNTKCKGMNQSRQRC